MSATTKAGPADSEGIVMAADGSGVGRLRGGWLVAAGVAAVGMVALGLLGALVSFTSVRDAMVPSFGNLAWTVPVGVDLGVAVFTALDLILVRAGLRMKMLRLVPWALVGVTIYLNVASEDHLIGAVGHGVLPLLWVLAVEVVIHVMRDLARLAGDEVTARAGRRARGRMDRVRLSRWLLAPLSTVALWRRMKLWEERSYPQALSRERERVLARCDLQDAYGRWAWRWKAPRRERALYRLGELAPATVLVDDASPAASSTTGAGLPGDDAPTSRRRRAPAPPTARPSGKRAGAATAGGNQAERQAAAAVWRASVAAGKPLTGVELAERYGRSARWGRDVIAEARQSTGDQEVAAAPPPAPPTAAPPAMVPGLPPLTLAAASNGNGKESGKGDGEAGTAATAAAAAGARR